MAFKKQKSSNWWRTQGGATELTLTQAGAGTGSAVIQGNQIIFDVEENYLNEFKNIVNKGYNNKELGHFPYSIETITKGDE